MQIKCCCYYYYYFFVVIFCLSWLLLLKGKPNEGKPSEGYLEGGGGGDRWKMHTVVYNVFYIQADAMALSEFKKI